jgi:SAM-dependent methyltransferase
MSAEGAGVPSLAVVGHLQYEVWKATALKTALELDVFTHVSRGAADLGTLAERTGCDRRGLRVLLDALCPLELLSKTGATYQLTPESEYYLVRDRPEFYGDWSLRTQLAWDVRGRSAEAVRTGAAVGGDFASPDSQEIWTGDFARALRTWPLRVDAALEMWRTLGVVPGQEQCRHVLDAACGPGVKSFALARADPQVRVTAFDFPPMVELAGKVAAAMGVADRVRLLGGDVAKDAFGEGEYDIALFGFILYYFRGERLEGILRRARQALKPGGLLAVNEYVADECRCRNEGALMAAFQLLLFAPDSEVRTLAEYRAVLEDAGFVDIAMPGETFITARKPG